MTVATPAAEPLSLDHRAEVTGLLRQLGEARSEYCFANLYLFRDVHRYRFVRADPPCILGVTYDGESHALPLTPVTPGNADRLLDIADCLYPLSEAAARSLYGFASDWSDDDSDYVYAADRMASLEGRALKDKRSQARGFAAATMPEATMLDEATTPLALVLLDRWLADTGRGVEATDHAECREALLRREELGLEGLMILGGGEPLAFLLASTLADGSKAVHFAKGRWQPAGAYPYLFSRYAARCGAAVLNFEQDLGKPGLRRNKRDLDPLGQLRKYRVRRR